MMSSPVISFLVFFMGFNFLIFIHELGHFVVARWAGIRATQFAIFFGQALVSWRSGIGFRLGSTEPEYRRRAVEHLRTRGIAPDHPAGSAAGEAGEGDSPRASDDGYSETQIYRAADELGLGGTEYRLNWLPLGGYVKMVGQEDLDPNARSADPHAYNNKSIPARMAVISAGVVMNLIFGLIFFIAAFQMGVEFPPSVVGGVNPSGPAAYTYAEGYEGNPVFRGLREGDVITAVDGSPVSEMNEVEIAAALGSPSEPERLTIERHGVDEPLTFPIKPAFLPGSRLLKFGVLPPATLEVALVSEGSAAYEAGVRPGMALRSVAGEPVADRGELMSVLRRHAGEVVELVYEGRPIEDGEAVDASRRVSFEAEVRRGLITRAPDEPENALGLVPAMAIVSVEPESPAAAAGIEAGDVLQRIGETHWPKTFAEVVRAVRGAGSGGVRVEVVRDGKSLSFEGIEPRRGRLGIGLGEAGDGTLAAVLPQTPAAEALVDFVPGTRISSVAGEAFESWGHLLNDAADAGDSLTLTLTLPVAGEPTETVELAVTEDWHAELAAAPVSLATGATPGLLTMTVVADSPIEAVSMGMVRTQRFVTETYLTLRGLLLGRVPVEELRGPVGIVQIGTIATSRGWSYLLFFLGLISINLAVINFLPIPIVDGGHIVFLIVEAIQGKPAGPRVQNAAMLVGLALIGSLFILLTYHDILRLITGEV